MKLPLLLASQESGRQTNYLPPSTPLAKRESSLENLQSRPWGWRIKGWLLTHPPHSQEPPLTHPPSFQSAVSETSTKRQKPNKQTKEPGGGFPGGARVKNLPANAGDTGSSTGPGRSHTPRSSYARAPQLLSTRA